VPVSWLEFAELAAAPWHAGPYNVFTLAPLRFRGVWRRLGPSGCSASVAGGSSEAWAEAASVPLPLLRAVGLRGYPAVTIVLWVVFASLAAGDAGVFRSSIVFAAVLNREPPSSNIFAFFCLDGLPAVGRRARAGSSLRTRSTPRR